MDIATLVGMIGAFALVIMSMVMGGDLSMFINGPSLLIVVGGSLFAVLMKFTLGQFLGAIKVAGKAFMFKMDSPDEVIEKVVELAGLARKGGLLSLEGQDVSNPFLGKGIQFLVDGHDADVVKTLLGKDRKLAIERHDWGTKIFTQLGDVAPAMGMIGTLIGLVAMLANMDDPKTIGPAMAVALLTTLYGAMLANMVFLPIADKLKVRIVEESLLQALIIDALLSIQSGQNPRVIDTMLRAYLPEGQRGDGGD